MCTSSGHALLFKTIGEQDDEVKSGVPADTCGDDAGAGGGDAEG